VLSIVAIVLGFCLWLCVWILPAVLWILVRGAGRRGATNMSSEERAHAERRSEELLRDLLDEREYRQLMRYGYLDVPSHCYAGRLYRIPYLPGRVCILEDGRAVAELCVQPLVPLPDNDMIVLHKLMIAENERDYLARANAFPIPAPLVIPWRDLDYWFAH